jgi:hypothetical protein
MASGDKLIRGADHTRMLAFDHEQG